MKRNYCDSVKIDFILQNAVIQTLYRITDYKTLYCQMLNEIGNHKKNSLGMQRGFKIRTKWIKHELTLMSLNCVEEASKYTIYYHDVIYISS